MTDIISAVRDSIADNYNYITDTQEYLTSKIFTMIEANIDSSSLAVYKNGTLWLITPVAGSTVTWSRTGTTITITKTAHGFITGDTATISVTSDAAALTLGAKTVTKLTDNTFIVVGLNAGASSGTCSYTVIANYSYSSTNGKLTVTGNLTAGDSLEFTYNAYSKYSDNEIRSYIRSAFSYLSMEKYKTFVARSDNTVYPTPSQDEIYLISFIVSVLIKDSISAYKTPEISITFNDKVSKEDKIRQVIRQFSKVFGVLDYVELDERIAVEDEDEFGDSD